MKISKKAILLSTLMVTSSISFAGGLMEYHEEVDEGKEREVIKIVIEEEEEAEPYWEILAMGAFATLDSDDFTLNETDDVKDKYFAEDSEWEAGSAQLGVGYVMPLFDAEEYSDEVQWFTAIEPQLNVYYLGGNLEGDVHRFGFAAFNEADYSVDVDSTRLMLDGALTVASWRNWSVYGIAGVGVAWNHLELEIKAKPGIDCPLDDAGGESDDQANFAYEFGAGITYDFSERLAFSVEYLYTGFADVDLELEDVTGFTDEEFESSNIDLRSQAIFLGFRFAI